MGENSMTDKSKGKFLTLSEFRQRAGIPLVWAKHLALRGQVKAIRAKDGSIRIAASEAERIKEFVKHPWRKAALFLKTLGPGLITGASDDDPSGIGTYSSVGAQFGFSILWTAAYLLPIFCILIALAFVRTLSPLLGGDIELPGVLKLI